MRESKGHMYDFVTHTWNPVKGKCMHECSYCNLREFNLKDVRLVEKEFEDLGKDKVIFVGSATDLFADNIPDDWIMRVFDHCEAHPENKYLFQSKNTNRLLKLVKKFPKNSMIGTTVESDIHYKNIMGKAEYPIIRLADMSQIKRLGREVFITIEPILDFDLDKFSSCLIMIKPDFINIGADSKNHNLPEPTRAKVLDLINKLKEHKIKINKKTNLDRLAGEEEEK